MTSAWGSRRSWGTKRSSRTFAGSPRPQGPGVGPAGGGDDEQVVVRQGAGGHQNEPAQVRVVERALGDVHDRAAALQLAPPRRLLEGRRRRGEDGPDEAHRGGEVRARVLEPRHRRLQEGVDHLGLQVDEVAGKTGRAGLGQPAPGEALNVGQHEVLGGPVHGRVAHPAQRARPGLERHPERRGVPAVRRVRHDADAGQRGARRARAQRKREGAEEHGVDHDAVGGEARQDGAQVAALAGERADEDPAQVVLDPAHAALGRRLASGLATIRSWASYSAAKGTKRAPVASTLSR